MPARDYRTPEWAKATTLGRAIYATDYVSWVYHMDDGTVRLANQPVPEFLPDGLDVNYGDRLRLIPANVPGELPRVDFSEVLERYDMEVDRIPRTA